jgi:hypothetical protein
MIEKFEPCFSRKAAYRWFAVILLGLMLRGEYLGVTSIVRELGLNPALYETMLHFFRSSTWKIETLVDKWVQIVRHIQLLSLEDHMPVFVIDGVKQSKEGKRMPGVKKLHQESENSAKPEYIHGHHFGVVGILIGTASRLFCLPLQATIQDGVSDVRKWQNSAVKTESHVVQLIRQTCLLAAKMANESIVLADRYFLSLPALSELISCQKQFQAPLAHMVTKAKISAVAYEKPAPRVGRGRPALKGKRVKLSELFTTRIDDFKTTTVMLYGKNQPVKYLCVDLLWGQKLYQELRFVLVKQGESRSILVCTNTGFSPEKIIRLYGYRFKIEVSFKNLKQLIHSFSYHFWTKSMPKLNRFAKKDAPSPLATIFDKRDQKKISAALKAVEGFVMLGLISLGLLQMLSLKFFSTENSAVLRWQRTRSKTVVSEAAVADFMRKSIFRVFLFFPNLPIVRFIRAKQLPIPDSGDLHFAS